MCSLEGPPTDGDWRPLENPGDALWERNSKMGGLGDRGHHLTFSSVLQVWIKVALRNLKVKDSQLFLA